MSVWDSAKDNYGWLISGAAALAGYLFRRRGQTAPSETAPTLRSRLTPSRIGRWLNAVKENERLRADLQKAEESRQWEAESFARREANWAAEREEMKDYATRIRSEITELAQQVTTLRTAQAEASSHSSAPPSTNSTASDATLLPPLPRPSE